jgi:hypothetical protein
VQDRVILWCSWVILIIELESSLENRKRNICLEF